MIVLGLCFYQAVRMLQTVMARDFFFLFSEFVRIHTQIWMCLLSTGLNFICYC